MCSEEKGIKYWTKPHWQFGSRPSQESLHVLLFGGSRASVWAQLKWRHPIFMGEKAWFGAWQCLGRCLSLLVCVSDTIRAAPSSVHSKWQIYLCRIWQVNTAFCLFYVHDTLHNWALFCSYPRPLLISPCKLLEGRGLILLILQNLAKLLTYRSHPLHIYLIKQQIKCYQTHDFQETALPAQ